ncbi:MAG: flavin reductase family protein [Christensenellales bacterium]|jgi:flavin reductase (DIM6/NTAB) family NADH-FMN oxidoreductase RutF
MKRLKSNILLKKAVEALGESDARGCFLVVGDENKANTMTIGWSSVGIMWALPVFEVPVRVNRYSHEFIEKNNCFTICIGKEEVRQHLAFVGSKSGRDVDKFEACGLTLQKARHIETPVIVESDYVIECRVLGKTQLTKENMDPQTHEKWYMRHEPGLHTLYKGEILDCYTP